MSQAASHPQEGPGAPADPADVLLRRLSLHAALSPAEADLVRDAARAPRWHPAHRQLCAEGAICPPRFLVSGWACRQRILADGRRQIVSFLLPGDPVGPLPLAPQHLPLPCSVVALTQVETVNGAALLGGPADGPDQPAPAAPGIARALRLMAWLGEWRLCDQVVRLGRQCAQERILHLLLELRDRLREAGLGTRDRFPLPLTQEVLADALGLSVVHVNRTLQQLRRDGLVSLRSGVAELPRPDVAEAMADWQPPPRLADQDAR